MKIDSSVIQSYIELSSHFMKSNSSGIRRFLTSFPVRTNHKVKRKGLWTTFLKLGIGRKGGEVFGSSLRKSPSIFTHHAFCLFIFLVSISEKTEEGTYTHFI